MPSPHLITDPLGTSGAEILALLWTHGPQTSRELHTHIRAGRQVAFTSTTTSIAHLVERGLLRHERITRPARLGLAYRYAPTATRAELLTEMVTALCTKLHATDEERATLAAMLCPEVAHV